MRAWQLVKNLYHRVQAHAWRWRYGRPDRGLMLYGITGTNGKTTTCYLLDSMLAEHFGRQRVGMMTTVALRIGERVVVNTTKLTTLPSRQVYHRLRDMRRAGVQHVVLELSSHALDQGRLAGVRLAGGIILNLEREHLDYHQTMAAYGRAKGKIISYLKPGASLVVREDIIEKLQIHPPAGGHKFQTLNLIRFTAEHAQSVITPLPGEWNRENVLAASLVARAGGVSEAAIEAGAHRVSQVPGRMEWVRTQNSPRVLIDYAVTPGALMRLYRYVRSETTGRIFAVLGAAGLRDRGKRPAMARAVAQFADEIILTREDPWTEDEEQIFKDLEQGLAPRSPRGAVGWRRIPDRREAIRYCLERAQRNAVVVVTGKGAEQSMAIGKKIIAWNDKQVVLELLGELEENKRMTKPQ